MPSITGRHMLNSELRLVLITAPHCSGVMRWNMESRVMPALLTRTSTGPRSASTFLRPVDAGFVGRHVPFVDVDAGLGLELLRRLVVAAVVGGDLVACGLERLRDRLADAARSTRHHRNACHDHSSLQFVYRRDDGRPTASARAGPSPGRPFSVVVLIAPRTWRCPCRRRCRAWRGPSWRCASASRRAASPARARRTRRSDGRSRSRRR